MPRSRCPSIVRACLLAACVRRVVRRGCSGKKIMSLAVTEPYAGSDVAGLLTTAVKERDAKTGEEFYVVNGLKKFITGGTRASYFTTAVRTSGPGMRGVSVLCIPAELEGVKATRMKTQGSALAAAATDDSPAQSSPARAGRWRRDHTQNNGCALLGARAAAARVAARARAAAQGRRHGPVPRRWEAARGRSSHTHPACVHASLSLLSPSPFLFRPRHTPAQMVDVVDGAGGLRQRAGARALPRGQGGTWFQVHNAQF